MHVCMQNAVLLYLQVVRRQASTSSEWGMCVAVGSMDWGRHEARARLNRCPLCGAPCVSK